MAIDSSMSVFPLSNSELTFMMFLMMKTMIVSAHQIEREHLINFARGHGSPHIFYVTFRIAIFFLSLSLPLYLSPRLFMDIYSDKRQTDASEWIRNRPFCRMLLCACTVIISCSISTTRKKKNDGEIILFNALDSHAVFFILSPLLLSTDCACAGKMPPGYMSDSYNSSLPFNPIATNGEPFPWFLPNLPNNVRPIRYALTIHPNLTTLDVKGKTDNTISPHLFLSVCMVCVQTEQISSECADIAVNGDYYYCHQINVFKWKNHENQMIARMKFYRLQAVMLKCQCLPATLTIMDFICIFAGQVTIEFHVEKETNFIVLHIQDLNITEKVI